ncbi:hypothetical protein BdWA1_002213 [Babesia duncani]|uniref:Uncharacterized protein n=1 Tax=Babesia duncani TaxID=323732 RepID=A0AAD9PLD5_9APIC|nr:hypothetical protein BdWA1_002213 [Babesia duncani]
MHYPPDIMSSDLKDTNVPQAAEKLAILTHKLQSAISKKRNLNDEKYLKLSSRCDKLRLQVEPLTLQALDSGDAQLFELLAETMHAATFALEEYNRIRNSKVDATGTRLSQSPQGGNASEAPSEEMARVNDDWAFFPQDDGDLEEFGNPKDLGDFGNPEDFGESMMESNHCKHSGKSQDATSWTGGPNDHINDDTFADQFLEGDLVPLKANFSTSVVNTPGACASQEVQFSSMAQPRYVALLEQCLERHALQVWLEIKNEELDMRNYILEKYMARPVEHKSVGNVDCSEGAHVLYEPLWRQKQATTAACNYIARFIRGSNVLMETGNFKLILNAHLDSNREIINATFRLVPKMHGLDCLMQLHLIPGLHALEIVHDSNLSLNAKLAVDTSDNRALGESTWPILSLSIIESDGTRFKCSIAAPLGSYQFMAPFKLEIKEFYRLWMLEEYKQCVQSRGFLSKIPLTTSDLVAPLSGMFTIVHSNGKLLMSARTPRLLVLATICLIEPSRILVQVATPCMHLLCNLMAAIKQLLAASATNEACTGDDAKVIPYNGLELPEPFAKPT